MPPQLKTEMQEMNDADIQVEKVYIWYNPDENYRMPLTNKALLPFQKVPKLALRAEIVELWVNGMQCIDIAKTLDIDTRMVSQAISRYLAKPDFNVRLESAV